MAAKSILIGGTASHVGKSWTATAICRWLRRRGISVAPFKAQNMSLNSYPCRTGGEIGRAQVAQAEACGLEPVSDMNPILLKPNSSMGSQVVVDGKVWRNLSAREYYQHHDFLLERVLAAFRRLASEYEFIVIEGAGSIAEMNLRATDLVNLGLARRIGAPVLLVADIDRGGVFASIVGTLALLDPDEAALVRSFAVNRFRGDPSLFADGVRFLEQRTARPCLGVFPWIDAPLDDEDSVSLEGRNGSSSAVAILRFPRISNFTDFRLLPDARWIDVPLDQQFDCVILPGSKNTIADLEWLRSRGLDVWIDGQRRSGARIVGICGGYQMLGERIDDPDGVESGRGSAQGLGLLPVRTVLAREKTTRVVEAATPAGHRFQAYEIHMGITERPAGCPPFALLPDGKEGVRLNGCIGTYLHGALEDAAVVEEMLGLRVAAPASKCETYDRLADWFEAHADIRRFEELYL
ncbi:MAG: cobyric acid synthase [Bryobacteraceae bacterium]